ncbi:MAG TPA: ABC transporter ATP-binding protein [Acidimicrobiales bacterium]|nr:ABC transporter ATP-binding protein [Acidimicrobiales bacterium]
MTLSIRDLDVSFGPRPVVDIDALDCAAGQIVGLVGESGSGKSMTATAVLGLAPRLGATVRGSITLDGLELVGAPERRLAEVRGRRIAMIFQSPSGAFNPVLRVGEVFVRTMRLHGERSRAAARKAATAALEEVLLPAACFDRYPHQLSGGQLQRVAIALALALRAEILLADEPTSALDVTVQAEILRLLLGLKERGLGVLLITHDLGVVAEVCDNVAVMRASRIVESGPTATVLARPSDEYTKSLLDAVPRLGSSSVAASPPGATAARAGTVSSPEGENARSL